MQVPHTYIDAPPAEAAHSGLLIADPQAFARDYNVRPFQFRHSLANHPMFALPRLVQVAERMLERGESQKFVALGASKAAVDSRFTSLEQGEKLAATVRNIDKAGTWLKISGAHAFDDEYDDLLQRLLAELETLAGFPLRREITWSTLTVFLASPRIVTPFHIDHESNFLFQIYGDKDYSAGDPKDPHMLSMLEIEDFYGGDYQAARYSEERQALGSHFRLAAGTVVHQPPLAPHWIRNGDNVSVSVSIGFFMRSLDRLARVYQVNHFLRKAGLSPTPPGRSALRDWLKASCIGMASKSGAKTPDDIMFSGISRLLAPPRALRRLVRSVRGGQPAT